MTKPILRQHRQQKRTYTPRNDNGPGWVYLVRDDGLVKVGLSGNPDYRFQRLQQAYGPLKKIAIVHTENMGWLERRMLRRYKNINVLRDNTKTGWTEWHRAGFLKGVEMKMFLYFDAFCVNCHALILPCTMLLLLACVLLGIVWL